MNKDIKLFFIDLDGTTLDTHTVDGQHWISDANIEAIKAARAEGKYVIISTGRIGANVKKYYDLVGGEYVIAGNGAQITNAKGKAVCENKMSVQQVLKVMEVLQKNNMVMKVDDDWNGYGATTAIQKYISKKFGFKPVDGFTFEMHKERYKIVSWGKVSKGRIQKVKAELEATVKDLSVVTSANGWTLEISHANATKGKGAEWVAEKLGIPKKHTAHIGDTMNDSTAVGHVGRLIVMANGDKELKKLSTFHGPSYKNAGLAKVLKGEYKNITKK